MCKRVGKTVNQSRLVFHLEYNFSIGYTVIRSTVCFRSSVYFTPLISIPTLDIHPYSLYLYLQWPVSSPVAIPSPLSSSSSLCLLFLRLLPSVCLATPNRLFNGSPRGFPNVLRTGRTKGTARAPTTRTNPMANRRVQQPMNCRTRVQW